MGEIGDGWLATAIEDPAIAKRCKDKISGYAEVAGRDPGEIGYQMMLDVPPRDEEGKKFYQNLDRVVARVEAVERMGFEWGALNATAIFQAGARSIEQIIDTLGKVHDAVHGR